MDEVVVELHLGIESRADDIECEHGTVFSEAVGFITKGLGVALEEARKGLEKIKHEGVQQSPPVAQGANLIHMRGRGSNLAMVKCAALGEINARLTSRLR